jgi:Tol biopolymer transport system component/putative cell wall-binding protein
MELSALGGIMEGQTIAKQADRDSSVAFGPGGISRSWLESNRRRIHRAVFCIGLIGAMLLVFVSAGSAFAHTIEPVDVSVTGGKPDGDSETAISTSADGRFVAFASFATNLVSGDTNGQCDVFVRDTAKDTTWLVSVGPLGVQGNGYSAYPSISGDGRYVAFVSYSTNLVSGDTNGKTDIFVHDRTTGITTRASLTNGGAQANGDSRLPKISADGRCVAFVSAAKNLTTGDTNGEPDYFVRNLVARTTARVNVSSSGAQSNERGGGDKNLSISADGRFVAFDCLASNLVPGDTNGAYDIFVRDVVAGKTSRVSVSSSGAQANAKSMWPAISATGRYVAFVSWASNLVSGDTYGYMDVFLHDRQTGTTRRISVGSGGAQGDGDSGGYPSISANGRYVAFESWACSLRGESGEGNFPIGFLFVHNRVSGVTEIVNEAVDGSLPDAGAEELCISGDGTVVAFNCQATNLVPDHAARGGSLYVASVDTAGVPITYDSYRGTDRYDTAAKLSRAAYPTALPAGAGLVLAPGESFPEALCGAPLAAAYGGPVLLTTKTFLSAPAEAELQRLAPSSVFCIGLAAPVVNRVKDVLPGVTVESITSANVYDMSYRVAKALKDKVGDMSTAAAIITIGSNYPDALGVSPLACAKRWPILLTGPSGALHPSAVAALSELGIHQAIKVGTYVGLPAGVAYLASLTGNNRYETNAKVANWAQANAGLTFAHTAIATGDKFPDALAAGPFLAKDGGILLLSPLPGPLPAPIGAVFTANQTAVRHFTFIAMIEPVVGQVKDLLP